MEVQNIKKGERAVKRRRIEFRIWSGGFWVFRIGEVDKNGIIIKWNSPYTSKAAETVAKLSLEFAILVIATFLLY